MAECVLLDGDAAAARAVMGRLPGTRDDLQARRACQEAIVAALEGDAAARDAALARAAALEARAAEGDQDLPGRLLPWRTAAETRRALERGWPPPGGVPFHPPGE
ncbi:MAG: hypothetical protein KF878_32070 [Planctomycetes bacterium]|nr:hypothetical protein [Planctomycetota bacterium]